jgi:hypothetical protein
MSSLFQPLEDVSEPLLSTEQAAHYLMRKPQTLRNWAMGRGKHPILPVRIGGRLGWPTAQVKKLCGVIK